MASVLQEWVTELPLMQQSVLLSSTRGCDGLSKDDVSKIIVREVRKIILVDAKPCESGHSFMSNTSIDVDLAIKQLISDIDYYPIHFIFHLLHAIEVIGYKYPDNRVRQLWNTYYNQIVHAFHLNPETEDQLNRRLTK